MATVKFEMLSTAPQSQVSLGILPDQGWGLELGDRLCGGSPPRAAVPLFFSFTWPWLYSITEC